MMNLEKLGHYLVRTPTSSSSLEIASLQSPRVTSSCPYCTEILWISCNLSLCLLLKVNLGFLIDGLIPTGLKSKASRRIPTRRHLRSRQ